MKKGIRLIVAGLVALVILSLFTVLYCNSGIHITNQSGATDYKWESNQLKTTMTEGFSWFRMDVNGFNNAYPPSKEINNLLMGSSHMEAIEISPLDNTGYLLNEMIPGYTYNIGISGHQIYNCVRNMSDAITEYAPDQFVIIETDRVDLNVESMLQVLNDTYPRIPSYDYGITYLLQKYIPAVKHIYNQIDVWKNGIEGMTVENDKNDNEYEALLCKFLKKAHDDATTSGAKLVIFYQPPTLIDEKGKLIAETKAEKLELFKKTCEANEIIFVDMGPAFEELYENENILAHGFINTSVGEGHLNKYGHRVVAEKLAEKIREESR